MSTKCRHCKCELAEPIPAACPYCGALNNNWLRIGAFLLGCVGFYLVMDAWGATCDFSIINYRYDTDPLIPLNSILFELRGWLLFAGILCLMGANSVRLLRIRFVEQFVDQWRDTVQSALTAPNLPRFSRAASICLRVLAIAGSLVVLCLAVIPYVMKLRLAYAVQANDVLKVQVLLRNGADPNSVYYGARRTRPILIVAIEEQKPEIARILLEYGAKPNAQDTEGNVPLAFALATGDASAFNVLLSHGADLKLMNRERETPLIAALKMYQDRPRRQSVPQGKPAELPFPVEMIYAVVNAGADINSVYPGQYTLLMYACEEGNADLAEYLIKRGADIEAKDENQSTPLFYAAGAPSESALTCLLSHHADARKKNMTGQTPLFHAVKSGTIGTARLLLDRHSNIGARDNDGKTAIMTAVECGQTKMVTYLLARGADINIKDNDGQTLLDRVANGEGREEMIALLKKAGAK